MVDEVGPEGGRGIDPLTLRYDGRVWCTTCGNATADPAGWTATLAGPGLPMATCRGCNRKPIDSETLITAFRMFAPLAIAGLWLAVFVETPAPDESELVTSALKWLAVAFVVQAYLREVARLAVVVARREQVHSIGLGAGEILLKRRVGSVLVVLRLLPLGAAAGTVATSRTRFGRAWLVAEAAVRPAFDATVLAASIAAWSITGDRIIWGAFAVVAAGRFLLTATVARGTHGDRSLATDGTRARAALRLPEPLLARKARAELASATLLPLVDGATSTAEVIDRLSQAVARDPSSVDDVARLALAQLLTSHGRYGEARRLTDELLATDLDPVSRAVLDNQAAWCRVCEGVELEQAHALAAASHAALPWNRHAEHTLVCAEVATGRPPHDQTLLRSTTSTTGVNQAIAAAYDAVAAHRAGARDFARVKLAEAEKKAPRLWPVVAAGELLRHGLGPLAPPQG